MIRRRTTRSVIFAVGAFLSIAFAAPFGLVLVNSFKPKVEILKDPLALPIEFSWENFEKAIEKMNYFQALTNSIIVTVAAVSALILTSSMLAYYLARSETKFSKSTFLILVASMIVPFQALMIPFVGMYGWFININEIFSLVVFYIGFGVALSTFLYHGFVKTIPRELDEAAAIDGAGDLAIFWRVIFPMLGPVTATVAIINALWIWNDFLLPSLVLSQDTYTLPLSTYLFYGQYAREFGQALAGLLLAVVPIILFYFFLQKQIVSGIAAGAVK